MAEKLTLEQTRVVISQMDLKQGVEYSRPEKSGFSIWVVTSIRVNSHDNRVYRLAPWKGLEPTTQKSLSCLRFCVVDSEKCHDMLFVNLLFCFYIAT